MKSPYVSELQPNQLITATFLVQHKDVRQKKTGEPYLSMILGDRTGEIEAKMWDNVAEIVDTFDRDDFLRVKGLLQVYQNRLQLTVHKLQRQSSDGVDFTDYFPASQRNPDEMYLELLALIDGVRDPYMRDLLSAMFTDAEFAEKFKIAPAAKTIHHAYLGGLIEHALSVANLAKLIAGHYSNIDLDLLLTGVLLHDIGKVDELSYDRSFAYSTEGQLLGHIVIGLRMLDEKIRLVPEFPPRLRTLLAHMIVSHHGELEFGSPKTPVFPEALLLHHLDNLDSKMEAMRAIIEKDRNLEGCWTGYSVTLERSVLKKSKYVDEPVAAKPPEAGADQLPSQQAAAAAASTTSSQQANSAQGVQNAPAPVTPVVPPKQPVMPGTAAGQKPASAPFKSFFGEKLLGALGRKEP